MNVHHLELFYYVAKHRGIVAACRNMPYGIQQPAVSAQIASLEEDLGVKLFQRRPFQLTAAGDRLYEFAAPFFSRLSEVEAELHGTLAQEFRLVGPTQILRDHLPALISQMRDSHPNLRLHLRGADQQTAEELLIAGEADLAITVLDERLRQGFRSLVLAKLPIVLLVPSDESLKSADKIIQAGCSGKNALIALPASERLPRLFNEFLRKKGASWPVSIEVNSNDLVPLYVSHGLGVGLTVQIPGAPPPDNIREIRVSSGLVLPVGAIWRGKPSPITAAFLDLVRNRVSTLPE